MPYGAARAEPQLRRPGSIKFAWTAPAGIVAALGGAELDPWRIVPGVGDAFVVFNLLSASFKLAHEASERQRVEQAAQAMQPCLAQLAGVLTDADHGSAFRAALEQAAAARGTPLELVRGPPPPARRAIGAHLAVDEAPRKPDADPSPGPRLFAALPILRLVEGDQRESLALEVAMDVRLQAGSGQALAYYSLLSYGPEQPARNPFAAQSPLYTRFVPERATPRPLTEWCGPGGADLLAAEIAAGLGYIATQVARDLYGR